MRLRLEAALTLAAAILFRTGPANAQQPGGTGDTVTLGALQEAAVQRDPRLRQLELLQAGSTLRLRNLDAERLPALSATGQGQYQSDVATVPIDPPGGVAVPTPPKDSYDAHLGLRHSLHDPTRGARRAIEQARLAEASARVASTLHGTRQQVNEAYFAVLLLAARAAELETGIADLEAQLQLAAERVAEGAALPSEAGMLEATLLRRMQALGEITADERAARQVLADLSGVALGQGTALRQPDLRPEVLRARGAVDGLRERPEYEQFALGRQLLDRQREAIAAGERPRLAAFGRAGYGRPGLNPLARDFDHYWLSGVQVEWSPISWGTTRRQREEIALQQAMLDTEEAAFTERIDREAIRELATIDRLEATLGSDDRIIELREEVLREARLRYTEQVVNAAEYVDRETDLSEARVTRATHRVQLAFARARFLTLLGMEVP